MVTVKILVRIAMLMVQNFTRKLITASACVEFISQSRTGNHGSFEFVHSKRKLWLRICMLKLHAELIFVSWYFHQSESNFVLFPFQIQSDPSCHAWVCSVTQCAFLPLQCLPVLFSCEPFAIGLDVRAFHTARMCVPPVPFPPRRRSERTTWTSATSRCARAPACRGG